MFENKSSHKGPIAWMAKNTVAANILMLILLVGGAFSAYLCKKELFPGFTLDMVSVTVIYPGANPEEIEKGVLLAVEDAVRSVDGVKRVTSTARVGVASTTVTLERGVNANQALGNVKTAIDQITSFPRAIEKPIVKLPVLSRGVISLTLYGDVPEPVLYHYAKMARDDLLNSGDITLVNIIGSGRREISIEVPKHNLEAYHLTLQQIADQVAQSSVEIPAGNIRTKSQDFAIRTNNRMYSIADFEKMTLLSGQNAAHVRLGDIANIKKGVEEIHELALFNGKPSLMLEVSRTGEQTPVSVADEVKAYQKELDLKLPPQIKSIIWNDMSHLYKQRLNMLLKNASLGIILVFLILGLFLELRLAFWVTLGIPISFLGCFLLFPNFDISINMISLFAFILALGIVVDDAIIVGENIYEYRNKGMSRLEAAILGAKEMSIPITFAVLTTIAAFTPMLFIPGVLGKFLFVIPMIVISVLAISLIESLFILPAHLSHSKREPKKSKLHLLQMRFTEIFSRWVVRYYKPTAKLAVKFRYVTLAISLALLVFSVGLVVGGRVPFAFMHSIDSQIVFIEALYPVGTSAKETKALRTKIIDAYDQTLAKLGNKDDSVGILTLIGVNIARNSPHGEGSAIQGNHLLSGLVVLADDDERNFTTHAFIDEWRKKIGVVPGLKSLTFDANIGARAGRPIDIQLEHNDNKVLEEVAFSLASTLHDFNELLDIENGISEGKKEFEFKIKPEGKRLGFTSRSLGIQMRNAFYGAEALRQQEGRDEIKVMVRLPESERESEYEIKNFLARTNLGQNVPLLEIANVIEGISYSIIRREDGHRFLNVTAKLADPTKGPGKVIASLQKSTFPELKQKHPNLNIAFAGEQREQQDTTKSMFFGSLFALLLIYALLAIPFKSYMQPIIVMSAIPFGIVGAIFGHLLLGLGMSMISILGIIALSGVVVNDSLVMIHTTNLNRLTGDLGVKDAVIDAGVRRFRPILLTSLTTFLGLAPMIFETELQAQFLIPMAVSLGFGVMFATLITLLMVPALYVVTDDVINLFKRK